MGDLTTFLRQYGDAVLLAWVFAEQVGLPLPATPVLLAAGALARNGPFHLGGMLAVAVCGCLLADMFWFRVGQHGGGTVLKFICRISLEPDSCVRRTRNVIAKYGPKYLLVVKFIPGVNQVAAPLAGSGGVSLPTFLLFDLLGSILWCGTFLGLGYLFRAEVYQIALLLGPYRWLLILSLLVVIPLVYIIFKYWQRRKSIQRMSTERITAEELRKRIHAGEAVTVVDLRHSLDFLADPRILPHAIRILPEEFEQKHQEIPKDRELVLYCTCPNDATSAQVALQLKNKGFQQVRVLAGGFYGWRDQGFPLIPFYPEREKEWKEEGERFTVVSRNVG